MLKLNRIKKSYKTGDFTQDALKNVSLSFRKNEFVAVLGQSGSGKTTMLNIIGGLDRYDSGDLIINNKSTKSFKDKDWDAYRNNCIGFIFQSYNLITHISILANVEMGMTLSGIGSAARKAKAMEVLEKVGLKDHVHKKPNQLSGGQMQRVAIARALANDPDVILADEPTGALDSETSVQIMELIREIAKDKLVIMVTHNPELANTYANRIIELKDGEVLSDSNPIEKDEEDSSQFNIVKTAMSYIAALKLSFNNIRTKKGRTILTSFASSIGIIGIALILALSNGFQMEIDAFEKDSLSQMPITVSTQSMQMDSETLANASGEGDEDLKKYTNKKKIYAQEDMRDTMMHTNNITPEYIEYIEKLDQKYLSGISYQKTTAMNIINYSDKNGYSLIDFSSQFDQWTLLPTEPNNNDNSGIIESLYDTLAGEVDETKPGLVLQVDAKNQLSKSALKQLGFDDEDIESLTFDEIMSKEVKVILNEDYYNNVGNHFMINTDYEKMYKSEKSITLKIQAIIRGKEDKEMITNGSGLAYTNAVIDTIIEKNQNSEIVKEQEKRDYNVLTGQPFDTKDGSTNTKETMMGYLGAESTPVAVYIYPKDFESKDHVLDYLDAYNEGKDAEDTIQYTDMAEMISSLSGDIMSAITIVLIAFSAISLIVSSIMIGIITYISVLERTKEIGILRALGARKKDITRVFNAETFIIGLCSGLIGIGIAQLLTIPANAIIENMSGLANVAKLNPIHALILIAISLILTLIGGFIPAKLAAKKDPVEALRSE
ncbi:putative ABC transport system permease protein [Breznakia sp. PF5-3]|uniref:ABC transporter ATP-binding protein/permease n=1 Tax=unclassified Breznakia TaxID=2623764 RepID=UPI002405837E|nr:MULTISPECIES: ABC transporter ATP-binding protein/permease [unclassified Breznakia]MDL2276611.1 ABC transporter ATP-binding protein/permease [Breznakia sp. OttesenSCG-928-G09]MDF9824655.1 putative ABC transport system permease protein [Breznakia sp. PM6-1]MDF9835640.1 putative ABC transport system permease protein [Breznakia sp. PF5-3]MDF9837695.1 putative ABC transport system permease protein [Breznakia sp. PFB2-8]MDF9859559.1 putative ABC transport system permease protein [Breznakia sp. P